MSHFTVLIIGDGIEAKLAPYAENLEVPPYIYQTRAELEQERKEIKEEAKNPPQDSCMNYDKYTDKMSLAEFAMAYHDAEIDTKGNLLSTYNPNSKWDWYAIGGRWEGMLTTKEGADTDQARLNMLNLDSKEFFTFAVITEDGAWHEKGEMYFFGNSSETEEEAEEWKKMYYDRFIKHLPSEILLTVMDCHI